MSEWGIQKRMKDTLAIKVWRLIWKSLVGFIGLSILLVVLFRFVPVPVTPLMVVRSVEQLFAGKRIELKHQWVPIEAISSRLALAVVCSEDQNFENHSGFDFGAIERSVKEARKGTGRLRGASTISQQTAKNVFLWPGRSWIRKGLEVYFTVVIEVVWDKERILEVYLNSIEMGDGVYGAEAASRTYFKTGAKNLSKRQAAAIAAVLPNPRRYSADRPSPYIRSRIDWIAGQMDRRKTVNVKKKSSSADT
jgi:monofunctional biosynthetic peptidoglycan transglycosylase